MTKDMTRILIETTIKNTIKQIKDDPERSMRNIVDMALNFTNGRFQQHLLTVAQTMLQNERSCYYKLIPDLVSNVDEERIITFGMNIGYNSCTIGAKKIREIEANGQYNIHSLGQLQHILELAEAFPECASEKCSIPYRYIQQIRMEQKYRTIPFDMIYDNLFIDSIISDEACSVGFTQDGDCYLLNNRTVHKNYNFFDCKLSEILSAVVPRKKF